jgi:hypothetical protein
MKAKEEQTMSVYFGGQIPAQAIAFGAKAKRKPTAEEIEAVTIAARNRADEGAVALTKKEYERNKTAVDEALKATVTTSKGELSGKDLLLAVRNAMSAAATDEKYIGRPAEIPLIRSKGVDFDAVVSSYPEGDQKLVINLLARLVNADIIDIHKYSGLEPYQTSVLRREKKKDVEKANIRLCSAGVGALKAMNALQAD